MIHFVESKEGENMQVKQILQLPLELINDVSCKQEIKDVYIGDLLSVVMAHGKPVHFLSPTAVTERQIRC